MEEKIAQFLASAQPDRVGGAAAVLAARDLFAEGWLDSLLHLRLIVFLERELGVRVPPFQAHTANFSSVGAIRALLDRLQAGA